MEIKHAASVGDLHDESNVNNTDRRTQIKRFSTLNRSRSKSLQKNSALTSLNNPNHHCNHDSPIRRPRFVPQHSENFSKPAECYEDVFSNPNDDFEPDTEAEEFTAEEADLEDDERLLDPNNADSSSACATPDILDEMADFDALPTKFGLAELLESHGAFFPEWREVPGLGIQADLPKEKVDGNGKEEIYEGSWIINTPFW